MSTYLITGKMGTGKTKSAVRIIQMALGEDLRVVTNLDLTMEHLKRPMSKHTVMRIPDKPTVEDLESIGIGNDTYDEEKNGIIVLDELASWMNSRTFGDKSRQPVLDWLIHSRKKGWHVYFICQNITQIDKQLRESLVEYLVRCTRLDKVKIPFVGWLLNLLSPKLGYLPRCHIATVRLGIERDSMIVDRLYYRGDDLHAAYDTRQIFTDSYPHGPHSVLSAWHVDGRYRGPVVKTTLLRKLADLLLASPAPTFKPLPARVLPGQSRRLIGLITKLPAEERIKHFRRLQASGVL